MRALATGALLLLLTPAVQASLLVTGFATNLPGAGNDDAFEITNLGPGPVDLSNVTVTDGEGRIGFPEGSSLPAGGSARVATDAQAYRDAARHEPDFAILGSGATMRTLERDFALAQKGDEILLEQGSAIVDAVVWGDSDYAGPGWVGPPLNATATALRWFPRVPGHDSQTKADWEQPQQPRLGWRTPSLPRVLVEAGRAYTAPDQSRAAVSAFLRQAETSLHLNVYEFRDVGLARDLLDRMHARPALAVSVLVDETPVGMDAEERLARDSILRELESAGATVRLMQHDRYPFDHAKYAIADGRRILVQSENLVPSAMPADAREGNRGWGLVLESPALAAELGRVFDDDFLPDPYGAQDFDASDHATIPLPDFVSATPRPRLEHAEAADFNATLVIGPEALLQTNDPMLAAIARAKDEILVEQLRVGRTWRDSAGRDWPNDYLNALLEAARRGVRVRILLDGHFLDEDAEDNQATLEELERAATLLPVETRLMRDADDPVLHVKGLVIDRRESWVGSMNWNLNSVAQNREVSVLVDAPEFAELFRDAFDHDWQRAEETAPTQTLIPAPDLALVAIVITGTILVRARRRA